MEFLHTVKDFFAHGMTGKAIGVAVFLWMLGRLGKFGWYRDARAKFGIFAQKLGVMVDKTLGAKLGTLWNPIEDVICDWAGLFMEQFCKGLRENDALAMAKQADRLQGVGSENRLGLVLKNLTEAIDKGAELPTNDPVVQNLLANMTDSAAQKTNE
jgi:hypothetical protein